MKNQEAFVYCWTDHKTNMLYVGCHKGRQDDGYICSSKWMLEEYSKRPEDFTRMILAEGTQDDCLMLETSVLKSVDAKHNSEYYNQHNGDGKFVLKKHTQATINNVSGENAYWYGKHHSKDTKKLLSVQRLGKSIWPLGRKELAERYKGDGNPFYGKIHEPEVIETISKKAIERFQNKENHPMNGKKHKSSSRRKMSLHHLGKTHTADSRKKMSDSQMGHYVSQETRNLISFTKRQKKLKGKKWYHDDTNNGVFYPNEQPSGWTLGRVKNNKEK